MASTQTPVEFLGVQLDQTAHSRGIECVQGLALACIASNTLDVLHDSLSAHRTAAAIVASVLVELSIRCGRPEQLAAFDPQRHVDKPDGALLEAGKLFGVFISQCPGVWNIVTQDTDVLVCALTPSSYCSEYHLVENWNNIRVEDVQERCANRQRSARFHAGELISTD